MHNPKSPCNSFTKISTHSSHHPHIQFPKPRHATIRRASYDNDTTTSSADQPTSKVQEFFKPGAEAEARENLFSTISPVYDELNDQLSFGMHKAWKRMTTRWSGARPGDTVLDVCCGSGDIAFCLADVVGPSGHVTGLDFSAAMIQDAGNRQKQREMMAGDTPAAAVSMQWLVGDALDLPFEDNAYDAATMGYGLRNVADRPKALRELLRVLKPGARVAILDFNNSTNGFVDGLQEWMLSNVVVPAARQKGVEAEYLYLRPSIKNFPTGRQLEQLALEAGFEKATHYEIGFSLMGVLVATKSKTKTTY